MEFQYRPAQPEDAPAIRLVALDSWHVTYRDIFTPDYIAQFLDRAYSVEALEHSIQRPGRIFEVATTLVGKVVGFMQYSNSGDGSELTRIYVHPNYFRCGIGGNMIRRLEDQLRLGRISLFLLCSQT